MEGARAAGVFRAEVQAVLEHGHHAEAEEIHFYDTEVFAVIFVPLEDDAAGHGGGFEGDDAVEAAAADDHAAGVLAEVAGQAAELGVEGQERREARVRGGQAAGGELLREVEGVRVIAARVE